MVHSIKSYGGHTKKEMAATIFSRHWISQVDLVQMLSAVKITKPCYIQMEETITLSLHLYGGVR